jgi:hypothetical protein
VKQRPFATRALKKAASSSANRLLQVHKLKTLLRVSLSSTSIHTVFSTGSAFQMDFIAIEGPVPTKHDLIILPFHFWHLGHLGRESIGCEYHL